MRNKINHNLGKYYIPGENLTIDEQLVPFKDRCSFVQYMAANSNKYEKKIWWLYDSESSYPLNGMPYLEKEVNKHTEGLAAYVVESLLEPYLHTKRNILYV